MYPTDHWQRSEPMHYRRNAEKYRFESVCFVLRADESRYADLLEELINGVYKGRDEYPTTVSDDYELLMRTY